MQVDVLLDGIKQLSRLQLRQPDGLIPRASACALPVAAMGIWRGSWAGSTWPIFCRW